MSVENENRGALAVVAASAEALRPLAGRTLLARALEASRGARRVGRVVVATGDAPVAVAARALGAEVLDMPSSWDGSAEATLGSALGGPERVLVWVAAGVPPAASGEIDGTLEALERGRANTARAVRRVAGRLLDGEGREAAGAPRYLDAGRVVAARAEALGGSGLVGPTALHVLAEDLGGPIDPEVSEVLVRRREAMDRRALLPDRLEALVFDFDGVFTDNKVTVLEEGREAVVCDRSDGLGLERLRKGGWPILVISKETHPIVSARCAKLKLECLQGIEEKLPVLTRWLEARGLSLEHTLYLGNDVNDLPCLTAVGLPASVADAYPEALAASRLVLSRAGGRGAIRELADLIAARYGGWNPPPR